MSTSLQWPLLAWMLLYATAGFVAWNRLCRPRIEIGWAAVLLILAIVPVAPALRTGYVYGPFDTNVPLLPWVDAANAGYKVRGGRLNDITLQALPWQAEARRQMLAGRAPLLNPFSGAGHPLLVQSAPFGLVSLLALPFEPLAGQALRAFLKLLLALTGTYLVARQLGCRPPASLFAAVAYAYGGSLAVWRLFPHAEIMALWPFAFLASERILADPGELRPRLLLGLALGGIVLSSHPETALAACVALASRWLFALLRSPRDPGRRRAVAVLLLCSVLAALGTSFFTLPVAQTVFGSEKLEREGGGGDAEGPITASGRARGGFLNLVVPGLFGTPQRSGEAGPAPLQWLVEGAVGLPAFALALGGLFLRGGGREERRIWLILLALVSFLLHLDPGGFLRCLFSLPLISVVAPRYFAYLGGFAVALLAARTLDLLTGQEQDRRALVWALSGMVLAGALVIAAHPLALRWWDSRGGIAAAVVAESARHAVIAGAVMAGLLLTLLVRRHALAAGSLAAALTAFQLWEALGGYYPVLPRKYAYPPVPLLDRLATEPSPFRLVGTRGVFMPNASTYYRLADIRAHDPTQPARYIAWLHEALDVDITKHKRQYGAPKRRHVPFLRLLGTRYLLSGPDLRPGPPWIDRGLFRKTRLWELPGEVRWAFFPATIVPVGSAQRAREVLLDAKRPLRMASLEIAGPESPVPNGRAEVLEVQATGDRLAIETKVEEDAWMVVSQAALPGWRARAAGRPVPTAIADGALVAVHVPAGTRTVTLRYLPSAWVVGVVLSLTAWIASAVLLLRARRRSLD